MDIMRGIAMNPEKGGDEMEPPSMHVHALRARAQNF